MSGEAEFDEPLSVDCGSHVFEDFDAAGVVFDEVVVGAEDGGDFALGGEWGNNKVGICPKIGSAVMPNTVVPVPLLSQSDLRLNGRV